MDDALRRAHDKAKSKRASRHRQDARAVSYHSNLSWSLSQLRQLAATGSRIDTATLDQVLKTANANAAGIGRYLSRNLGSLPYNDLVRGGRGAVKRVFDIPELLEMIIDQLPFLQILRAQSINRQWRDAVNGSVQLQRKLLLTPLPPKSLFFAPFNDIYVLPGFRTLHMFAPNLVVFPNEASDFTTNTLNFRALFNDVRGSRIHLPKNVGSRFHKMQICHPPIINLNAYTNCCTGRQRAMQPAVDKVNNPNGITIGDLWTKTKELMQQHENCPNAGELTHDLDTGKVQVQVEYRIDMELDEEHSLVKEKRLRKVSSEALRMSYGRHFEKTRVLRLFIQAKAAAHSTGEPIPTFEEFKSK